MPIIRRSWSACACAKSVESKTCSNATEISFRRDGVIGFVREVQVLMARVKQGGKSTLMTVGGVLVTNPQTMAVELHLTRGGSNKGCPGKANVYTKEEMRAQDNTPCDPASMRANHPIGLESFEAAEVDLDVNPLHQEWNLGVGARAVSGDYKVALEDIRYAWRGQLSGRSTDADQIVEHFADDMGMQEELEEMTESSEMEE